MNVVGFDGSGSDGGLEGKRVGGVPFSSSFFLSANTKAYTSPTVVDTITVMIMTMKQQTLDRNLSFWSPVEGLVEADTVDEEDGLEALEFSFDPLLDFSFNSLFDF
jgi:hypothetical protein